MQLDDLIFRNARISDATSLVELCQISFGDSYVEQAERDLAFSFLDVIYSPHTLVGSLGGQIVSLVQLSWCHLMPNTYALSWLCVIPSMRGRGIGAETMKYSLGYAKRVLFSEGQGTVYLSSSVKPEYYEKFGFIRGPLNHHDAPVMLKTL